LEDYVHDVFAYEYFVFLGRVTNPSAKPPFLKRSSTPHETMAMHRCQNRWNDRIHGGRWWWWWWRWCAWHV